MSIVGGFDIHRKQITFDYLDVETRGQIVPADRAHLAGWLAEHFAGRRDVEFAVEGCTGWRYVAEELARAGVVAHVAEPADTAALRGRKRHAKTGPRNNARRLKLSDVQQPVVLGEPICVGEAARLHCPTDAALIPAGQLRARPGSRYPVYRPEVEELARRSGVDSRDRPIPFGPVGRVPTSDAARILGLSKQETRALAAAELIPAVRDHRGYYWYRAETTPRWSPAPVTRENRIINRRATSSAFSVAPPNAPLRADFWSLATVAAR